MTCQVPSRDELLSLLLEAWRSRRDTLELSEAAGFFQISEDQVIPILRKLASYFYRELAQIPSLRDPLLVTAALTQINRLHSTSQPAKASLLPINGMGMNVVLLGTQSEEPNARFWIHVKFHLLVSGGPALLQGFAGTYWAYGCPCLNGQPELIVDGETRDLEPDWGHLRRPVQLQPGVALSVTYRRAQRPPLMKNRPDDCDYGDITVNLSILTLEGEQASTHLAFRFEPGGLLQAIKEVRPVPRLSDQEIDLWRNLGKIDEFQYERLKKAGSVTRYMATVTDNDTFGPSFGLTPNDVVLMRYLIGLAPPIEGE